jgi:hypothetical protein
MADADPGDSRDGEPPADAWAGYTSEDLQEAAVDMGYYFVPPTRNDRAAEALAAPPAEASDAGSSTEPSGAADAEGGGSDSGSTGSARPSWRDVAVTAAASARRAAAAAAATAAPRRVVPSRQEQPHPRRVEAQATPRTRLARAAHVAGPPRPEEQYAATGRRQRETRLGSQGGRWR